MTRGVDTNLENVNLLQVPLARLFLKILLCRVDPEKQKQNGFTVNE